MPTGQVKWFDDRKGYGFIQPELSGPDVFVHASAVRNSGLQMLVKGAVVSYNLMPGKNGRLCACDIKLR